MHIGILGHFGGKAYYTDGQTVKVKSLYHALHKKRKDIKIDCIDTYYLRHNRLKLAMSFIKMLLFDKVIIFLPAFGGRKVLFRLFYYLSKYCRKKVFHDCIAGSLDQEIWEHPNWVKYLNEFKSNWMESPEQVEKLKDMGIKNVKYVPNFKDLKKVSREHIHSVKYNKPYKFCIFSRVEPMKGIEDAIIAIHKVNQKNRGCATLDIYGPIQPGFEVWFEEIKRKYGEDFNYNGVVAPNKSVETLKDYFALLFPTRYFTEGMPGTIIDSMFAGLPVIVRKWAWCDNMVKNGYNGIVYDFDKPDFLNTIIKDVCDTPDKILQMKENCLVESERYSEENVIEFIINELKLQNM